MPCVWYQTTTQANERASSAGCMERYLVAVCSETWAGWICAGHCRETGRLQAAHDVFCVGLRGNTRLGSDEQLSDYVKLGDCSNIPTLYSLPNPAAADEHEHVSFVVWPSVEVRCPMMPSQSNNWVWYRKRSKQSLNSDSLDSFSQSKMWMFILAYGLQSIFPYDNTKNDTLAHSYHTKYLHKVVHGRLLICYLFSLL